MEGAAVGSLVAGTLRPVADKVSSLVTTEVAQIWDLENGIRQLKSKLDLIDGFLDDAGKKQFENKAVEAWVGHLKQIAYDAEDVIETFLAVQPQIVIQLAEIQNMGMKNLVMALEFTVRNLM